MNALLGSIGGLTKAARQNAEQRAADTAAARANGPGALEYWEQKVDPDGDMTPAERTKCAVAAKKAHFQRLALLSAKARSGIRISQAEVDKVNDDLPEAFKSSRREAANLRAALAEHDGGE
jgi:hypothetical protein